jgi:hypothetical protein
MSEYKARKGSWDCQQAYAEHDDDSDCLLELLARVEALERGAAPAAADVATDPAPAVKDPSAPFPAGSLVDRIEARAGGDGRAAIREVAAWLRTGRMLNAAELLEHEADR